VTGDYTVNKYREVNRSWFLMDNAIQQHKDLVYTQSLRLHLALEAGPVMYRNAGAERSWASTCPVKQGQNGE